MSTNVASVVSHFPDVENGFTTTTAGSVSSGAATVTLNSLAGYTNGEPVVFVIDPTDAAKKQTFTGIADTAGVQVTSVVWTAGTNQTHALGATVVDYATATHIAMMSKGIKVQHKQTGAHSAITADSLSVSGTSTLTGDVTIGGSLTIGGAGSGGWDPISGTITAVTANGNRNYDLTTSADNTTLISPGMRLRTTRTVAAPTQCTDLEASSSQYYSKTSPNKLTFTDDFTCMGWVKLESYGAVGGIIGRRNADTEGWSFGIIDTGQVQLGALRIAANNSFTNSYQSIPLGRWVHVAATADLSGTSVLLYIDGVLVPSLTTITGTITAIVQGTTALTVGALKSAGTNPFDGKIAQAAVFDAVLSASTIRSYISQGLSGSETSLFIQ